MGWDGVQFSSSLQNKRGWCSVQLWLQRKAERPAAGPCACAGSRPPGHLAVCMAATQAWKVHHPGKTHASKQQCSVQAPMSGNLKGCSRRTDALSKTLKIIFELMLKTKVRALVDKRPS